jgi:hypothetical protein
VDKNETIIFEIKAKIVNIFFLAADAVRLSRSIVFFFNISKTTDSNSSVVVVVVCSLQGILLFR